MAARTWLALVALGLACAQAPAPAQTIDKVAASNRITVGYREAAVPFSYLAAPGQPIGFSADLTAAIVDELRRTLGRPGLQVDYRAVTGQNRIPLLVDGSYDLECGSTTNNAARGREVAFSVSFFYAGTRLLTKTGSGIRDFGDLAGRTAATAAGSASEKIVREHMAGLKKDVTLVLGKDYAEALALVEEGKADALALDDVLLYGLRANSKDPAAVAVVGKALQVEPYGCMVRRDDAAFKQLVDRVIAGMMTSGEFARLYARWFESPIPPKGVNLAMPMSPRLQANLKELSDKPAF